MIAMPHGRRWFPDLIEASGYAKVKDLWAYHYPVGAELDPRRRRALERVHGMERVRVRPFDKRNLRRDVRLAAEVYNDAWQHNWGSTPITEAEADRLANDLVQFRRPEAHRDGGDRRRGSGDGHRDPEPERVRPRH